MLLSTPTVQTGWQARPFTLSDPDGQAHSLKNLYGQHGLVIAFICNHCPYVKAIADRFADDANILQSEGVNVVAINPNDYDSVPDDSPPIMKRFAEKHGLVFRISSMKTSRSPASTTPFALLIFSASTPLENCSTGAVWIMHAWETRLTERPNYSTRCAALQRPVKARTFNIQAWAAQSSGARPEPESRNHPYQVLMQNCHSSGFVSELTRGLSPSGRPCTSQRIQVVVATPVLAALMNQRRTIRPAQKRSR